MAVKTKTLYRCQSCGFSSAKWLGQCPDCGEWNTLAEEAAPRAASSSQPRRALTEFSSELVRLSDASADPAERRPTGIGELDRLLGGGLVAGQVALLAGPPGIGKSTLMLQIAQALAASPLGGPILYVSGEESAGQVAARAKRLGVDNGRIYFASETNLARVLEAAEKLKPAVWIVDSIQTVYHPEWAGSPGTVGQVRECAAELLRAAKASGAILFLLGHVTKEGDLAGPRVLEHIVDTVLHFDADKHHLLRLLRAHKNRFGSTSEIAIFEMGERGLREVSDASAFFVQGGGEPLAGRAISVAVEGTRPILAEVQALVAPTRYPLPRRMVTGLDPNRTLVLLAALEKHLKLHLESKDVFVSLAGGLKLRDPALDLAVCAAVLSSVREAPAAPDRAFVGEVGLLGEVGRVPLMAARLGEARRMGFKSAAVSAKSEALKGFTVVALDRLHGLPGALA
jgi:DNA repair protein RadA/Sms